MMRKQTRDMLYRSFSWASDKAEGRREMALRVFVSHSHKDAAWCDPFVDALASYGIDIWYDRQSLRAGAQWVRTIEDELSTCDVFLVVLTPESWASDWVREELALAFASKKRIIGIMQMPTQVSGFIV